MTRPILALIVAMTMFTNAHAQRIFMVHAATPLDGWTRKLVCMVVQDQDPTAMVSFDEQLFKIRSVTHVTGADFVDALNGAGLGSFVLVTDLAKSATTFTSDDFPVRMNSGDPVHDKTAYEEAKVAWITAHPEAYEAMGRSVAGSDQVAPSHSPE